MRLSNTLMGAAAALSLSAGIAEAAGELHIYNWGNYTAPRMIEKFEKQYDVKVTVTEYDSSDTALAKIKAGGHGFDMVVPTQNFIPIFIHEGLFLEARPDQMENFKNVIPMFIKPAWDPENHYVAPWLWGTTGIAVNTKFYTGNITSWSLIFDPPEELKGKINVVPVMNDVINAVMMYKGYPICDADRAHLKELRDILKNAKSNWISMNYDSGSMISRGDYYVGLSWNGTTLSTRLEDPAVHYVYPDEGVVVGGDFLAILKDAKNVQNAKLFMNFVMDPENAGLLSEFGKSATGITGSEKFLPKEIAGAPEVVMPKTVKTAYGKTCPSEVNEIYSKIWIEVMR